MKPVDSFPILQIDDFQFRENTDLCLLDHELAGQPTFSSAHKHNFYLLFLIEQSSGNHLIDFQNYEVSDFQLHILRPGQVHFWEIAVETKGFQLMCSEKLMGNIQELVQFKRFLRGHAPVTNLSASEFKLLQREFNLLNEEIKLSIPDQPIIFTRTLLIIQLINRLLFHHPIVQEVQDSHPLIEAYLDLIDLHYQEHHGVGYYASQLKITANYLNMLCQKYLHKNANQMIQQRVLLESKRLLIASPLQIKEIAYQLGFQDLPYFSNFFKKHTHVSPKAFRLRKK